MKVFKFLLVITLCLFASNCYLQVILQPENSGPFFNESPTLIQDLSVNEDTVRLDIHFNEIDGNKESYSLYVSDAEIQELKIGGRTFYAGKYQDVRKLSNIWDYRHFTLPAQLLEASQAEYSGYNLSSQKVITRPALFEVKVLNEGMIDLISKSKKGIVFTIFFLGAIFIFLVYSLGLFIQTRNPDFRFYGYYLLAIFIHNAIQADAFLKIFVLFPKNPIYYHYVNEFFQMFIYAFFMLFVKVFMELKTQKPNLLSFVNGSIYFTIGCGLLFLLVALTTSNFHIIQNYLSILWIVVAILGTIIVLRVYRNSANPVKNYILIGSILLLVGSILELATSLSLEGGYNWNLYAIPRAGWYPFNFTQLAIIGEIVCFALGIGKKIRLRDQAYNELQNQEIQKLRSKEELQIAKRAVLEKELDSLRSQMNPHFLFNSLTSMNDFIMKEEPQKASRYLTKFAKLMRVILNNSRRKDITLNEELEALSLYVELERLRFKNRFEYRLELSKDVDGERILIPSMLIQPYVENAIKHGLFEKENGILKVAIGIEEKTLTIIIEDNGVGRKASLSKSGVSDRKSHGMDITTDRIDLINRIYHTNASVAIEDLVLQGRAAGTRVTLSLSVIYKNEDR